MDDVYLIAALIPVVTIALLTLSPLIFKRIRPPFPTLAQQLRHEQTAHICELGYLSATYKTSDTGELFGAAVGLILTIMGLTAAWIFLANFSLQALTSFSPLYLLAPLVILVWTSIGIGAMLYPFLRKKSLVSVYDAGLIYSWKGRSDEIVRWEQVEAYTQHFVKGDSESPDKYTYTVKRDDGMELLFKEEIEDVYKLGMRSGRSK